MSKQMLEMAIEALYETKDIIRDLCLVYGNPYPDATFDRVDEAIAALKEAVKTQGEPVAFIHRTKRQDHLSFFNSLDTISAHETYLETVALCPCTSAPTIPEGWQLVPIEPTPKMIHEGQMSRLCPVTGSESAAAIYKAMLSAAPKGDKP